MNKKSAFKAAANGQIAPIMKFLINNDINSENKDGYTLLHIAAANGHIELMSYLLQKGIDINYHTAFNYTPIEYACVCKQKAAVKMLLENNCDIKDENNYSGHLAAAAGCEAILVNLIKYGFDVNRFDYAKFTPLRWAAQEGHLNIVKLLISHGAHINVLDDSGQTPLYISAAENYLEIVRYLLQEGAHVDYTGNTTPLMIACAFENFTIAIELLKAGADVNYQDSDGRTALFYAKVRDNKTTYDFLMKNGAMETICDKHGISVIDLRNDKIRRKVYKEIC